MGLIPCIEQSPLQAQKETSQFKFNEKNSEREKIGVREAQTLDLRITRSYETYAWTLDLS